MANEIVRVGPGGGALSDASPHKQKAAMYAASPPRAVNTLRAHALHWKEFEAFCRREGDQSMPASPATVAAFAHFLASDGRKLKGIELALSVISSKHMDAGYPSPVAATGVRNNMKQIRVEIGAAVNKKAALFADDVKAMVDALPATPAGTRDRALLLLGFSGAFRRSELAVVQVEHITWHPEGIRVLLPRSKTNQEGKTEFKLVAKSTGPHCPVDAMRNWLACSGISSGPVFRRIDQWGHVGTRALSGKAIADIVKRSCVAAGMDPTNFAGHSLRSGLVSEAKKRGRSGASIILVTGHKREERLKDYDQHVLRFSEVANYGLLDD